MYKVKVELFEGPLDLLLQLIEDQKLEITKVSLSVITEQYIKILNQSEPGQLRAEELADFLVIAARLLLIKSKALLPFLQWGDEDEGEELTQQLKIYKEYLEASKVITGLINKKKFAFARQKMLVDNEIEFAPPPKLKASDLAVSFAQIIRALDPFVNLPLEVIRKTISIQEKIASIRAKIYSNATTNFSEILKEAKDRTEVIVSFLALLELIKQRAVFVNQSNTFDDIIIEKL
ncbi:MAG: segregation/condensation protein A [Patescibacteria group bacterium]|nr:segregation/condensation protein A [Patescibacteria group bacterium]